MLEERKIRRSRCQRRPALAAGFPNCITSVYGYAGCREKCQTETIRPALIEILQSGQLIDRRQADVAPADVEGCLPIFQQVIFSRLPQDHRCLGG